MTNQLNPVPRPDIVDKAGMLKGPWQSWFSQVYTWLTAPASGGGAGFINNTRQVNTTAPLTGGGALSSDLTLALATNGITNAFLAQMAGGTIKGNNLGGSSNPLDLTTTQVTAMLNQFSSTLQGLVPPSGGGTTNFLRADGTFAAPPTAATGANPSAKVGLNAVNGSASTFLRSDGAPPLDVSISPQWTGNHQFNGAGTQILVSPTGAALVELIGNGGAASLEFSGNATANILTLQQLSTGVANLINASAAALNIGTGNATGISLASNNVATFTPAAAANPSMQLTSLNTTSGGDMQVVRASTTANTVGAGANITLEDSGAQTYSILQHAGGQTELWQYNGSWAQIFKVLTGHGFQHTGAIGVNNVTPPAQTTGFGTPTGNVVISNFPGASATLVQCSETIAEILLILKGIGFIGA